LRFLEEETSSHLRNLSQEIVEEDAKEKEWKDARRDDQLRVSAGKTV